MHAERLLQTIRVPSLVLTALVVFLLEHGQQTDRQTRLNAMPASVNINTQMYRRRRASVKKQHFLRQE